jgi:hypothetical protein
MKYSIFNRLNRVRKSAEMFSARKGVVENCVQLEGQPSIEHRTGLQLELQELRNLILRSEVFETPQSSGFGEGHEIALFQTELDEKLKQAEMR